MSDKFPWGPANPHPLSQMRTELIWEGRFDEYGRRREVEVAGHVMPLLKIESVIPDFETAALLGVFAAADTRIPE